MKLQRPKGTQDIFGKTMQSFSYIDALAQSVFETYNFQKIETPLFEHYELFSRATGETSDIATKEMYDFMDKGNRHIALRPEGTASAVRAYIENKFYAPEVQKPVKLWYSGPMFRYERPQSGRLREFHQLGAECFGSQNPAVDVDVMYMVYDLFTVLGLSRTVFHINSLGDAETRKAYRQALVEYLTPYKSQLSPDSQRRLEENPLRILDSKESVDQKILEKAPSILDYLTGSSRQHFETVQEMLDALELPYVIDATMVRGLDYYNDTVFELMTTVDGQALTICGGGRYDALVSHFDGPETPAFGFAIGLERLMMVLEAGEIAPSAENELQVYIAVLGEAANKEATTLLAALRAQGVSADRDFLDRKLVAQYKTAASYGAEVILTLGDDEVSRKVVKVRNPESRKEVELPIAELYRDFAAVYEKALTED
jgi:histidyl-tRNA synthetase